MSDSTWYSTAIIGVVVVVVVALLRKFKVIEVTSPWLTIRASNEDPPTKKRR